MDPVLSWIARLLVALVFAQAARHKLVDRLRFEGIVSDYRLAPAGWSRPIASGLVGVELLLVPLLLLPGTASPAALAATGLLVGYALAIGFNLARGRREIECGCGGPGETLHPRLLGRNALLVAVCAVAAAPPVPRSLGLLDTATIALAVTTLGLLWLAGGRLASLVAMAPTPVSERSAS